MSIYDEILGDLADVGPQRNQRTAADVLRESSSRRNARRASQILTPEEEQEATSSFLSKVLNPIVWVGEALAKPGRALYGTASGLIDLLQGESPDFGGGLLNLIPFSDTMGITDPDKSVYGRDLLGNLLFNDKTNPEGLDTLDVLGFGLDLFAPGAPVGKVATFGGKALARSGLDDALKAMKPLTGPRVKALTTTLQDVLGTSPATLQTAKAAAEGIKVPAWQKAAEFFTRGKVLTNAERFDEALTQPLAKMSGVSFLPFSEPTALSNFSLLDPLTKVIPGGPTAAEALAGGMDAVGRFIRHGNPIGRYASKAFSPDAGEGFTGTFQRTVAPGTEAAKRAARAEAKGSVGNAMLHLDEAIRKDPAGLGAKAIDDLDIPDVKAKVFRWLEGHETPAPAYQQFVDDISPPSKELLDDSLEWGTGLKELVDDSSEYARRRWLGQTPGEAANEFTALPYDPSKQARHLELKNTPNGTSDLVLLFSDPDILAMKQQKRKVADIAAKIAQNHPHIPDTYVSKLPKVNSRGAQTAPAVISTGRHEKLAEKILGAGEEELKHGGYADPLMSAHLGFAASKEAHAARKQVLEYLSDQSLIAEAWREAGQGTPGVKLGAVLRKSGYDAQAALKKLAQLRGIKPTQKNIGALGRSTLPIEFAKDILRYHKTQKDMPDWVERFLKPLDTFNALFKLGVLTHPANKFRDWVSGHIRGFTEGAFSGKDIGSARAIIKGVDAAAAAGGKPMPKQITRLLDNPVIAAKIKELGLPADGKHAADVLRAYVEQFDLVPSAVSETIGPQGVVKPAGAIGDLTSSLPGGLGGSRPSMTKKEMARTFAARPGTKARSLNPLDIPQITGKDMGFGPGIVSDELGWQIGAEHRISGWLALTRKGFTPEAAAKKIKDIHLDYSIRGPSGTAIQQTVMTRLFPFYRFMRANTPWVYHQLLTKPKGSAGVLAATKNRVEDKDLPLPEAYSQGLAIPLPWTGADGSPRLLTQLGLMDEDALKKLPRGIRSAAHHVLADANPLLKFLVETTTGTSAFQEDYDTARSLADMRPLVGQTISNIASQFGVENFPVRPSEGKLLTEAASVAESAIGNSPLSRLIGNLRTLTDPRKGLGAKLGNILTGLKVTDIPKDQQDAILEDLLAAEVLSRGGRKFERVYMPADRRATLEAASKAGSPEDAAALTLMALRSTLSERAKREAKAREKAKKGER